MPAIYKMPNIYMSESSDLLTLFDLLRTLIRRCKTYPVPIV